MVKLYIIKSFIILFIFCSFNYKTDIGFEYNSINSNVTIYFDSFKLDNNQNVISTYYLRFKSGMTAVKTEKLKCIYSQNFITFYDNPYLYKNPMSINLKESKLKNKNLIKLNFSKEITPCWIKINDSMIRIDAKRKVVFESNYLFLDISIIPDSDNFKLLNYKIINGTSAYFYISNHGVRGILMPQEAKFKYGYFKNDTLICLGIGNNNLYKFIKIK